ncbi:hypothetical protein M885DRAFT_540816 [Pelagophyceae sp. CCMP2097]|nr:hypothetical protein M885DRAFT_540816 [Pelagophyceae sp. CCMP2097]
MGIPAVRAMRLAWPLLALCAAVGAGRVFPVLPERYTVSVEANIENKRYSTVQRESYDGKNKLEFVSLTNTDGTHTRKVDLEPGLTVHWVATDDGVFDCWVREASDPWLFSATGHIKTSNDFLGASQNDEVYVGIAAARGIDTNRWLRTANKSTSRGQMYYELLWDFAQDDWLFDGAPESGTPVRATLKGEVTAGGSSRSFLHSYEFTAFERSVQDSHFRVPLPLYVDESSPAKLRESGYDTDGITAWCNASTIAHNSSLVEAVRALGSSYAYAVAAIAYDDTYDDDVKVFERGEGAAIGAVMLIVGVAIGVCAGQLCARSKKAKASREELDGILMRVNDATPNGVGDRRASNGVGDRSRPGKPAAGKAASRTAMV